VVAVGGHDSGALIAFDAKSGAELWSRAEEGPGYASPVVMELGGVRQVVTQMQGSVIGVATATGELMWRIPFDTAYFQNIVTPLLVGDRLIYSGLDKGTTAVRPVKSESGFKVETLWHSDEVALYMSSPIQVGDRICGLSHKRKGQLFCLDAATGKTIWTNEGRVGDNAAVYAAGTVLLMLTDGGELIVANAAGSTYQELARYDVAPKATWSSPAVVGKTLLVKDYDSLLSVGLP
jgi:outer membrane protein assembly factor BamB